MVVVVDCTLRDGGYCNDWAFSRDTARACYRAAADGGAGVCEVGFRRARADKGVLYHCPEAVLTEWFADVKQPDCAIAVMAQMGTFGLDDFPAAAESVVDMVRVLVAYHSKDKDDAVLDDALIAESVAMCAALRAKGYRVSLNVGRAEKLSDAMWRQVLAAAKGSVDALYFADTYGALTAGRIVELGALCAETNVPAGFHFHNNAEDANLKAAIVMGGGHAEYVDGTMGGYGRGSGNTKLEYICPNPLPVLAFVDEHLYGYQHRKGAPFQGYNVLYVMTAERGFHVNYANELIAADTKYTIAQIDRAFEALARAGRGPYYVKGYLDAALSL